jgi:23S rRNA (uracil1939-C5)-methyltransferase
VGKHIEGRARDITQGGEAVLETEQGIVMARGALPGERVVVELTGRAQGTLHGRVREVRQAHPERQTPRCPVVEACGGCPLMALGPAAQRAWKKGHIERALAGSVEAGALDVEVIESPDTYGYRTRARLTFLRTKNGLVLGYFAAGSRELVDVEVCAVLAPQLAEASALVRRHMNGLTGRGEAQLALGVGGRAVVQVACDALQTPEVYRALEALAAEPALAGVSLTVEGGAPVTHGDVRQQAIDRDGQPVWGPPFGFAQANDRLNQALVAHVLELADAADCKVLELYAGHGNFTLGLAAKARAVVAVESDRRAAETCRQNARERGLANVRVRAEDAAKVAAEKASFDVVVLDPPRAGAKDALAGIAAAKPARIVYVSCDPATLRRDLGLLLGLGYRASHARGFDMFPHTPHVETVVRLERIALKKP